MYRVIIVDDEKWALVAIRKFLALAEGVFEVVYETVHPTAALEAIDTLQPDLVFTDIRMPGLSGIELINQSRAHGSRAEFVMISGFSDFEYAQQALRAGALDYLLKPLDVLHAEELLDRIVHELEKTRHTDDLALYSRLLAEQSAPADLMRLRCALPLMPMWRAVCLLRSSNEKIAVQLENFSDWQGVVLKIGPRKLVWIINSMQDCNHALDEAIAALEDQIICCGISPSAITVDKLPALLRMAEDSIYETFLYPDRKVFYFRHAQPSKVVSLWQRFQQDLQDDRLDTLCASLKQLPDKFRSQHMTVTDAANLWNLFAENMSTDFSEYDAQMEIPHLRPYTLLEMFHDMEAMCQYLTDLFANQHRAQDGSTSQHFRRLLRYIDQHYMDSLNLQELCDRYFINVSYCCVLFRKETQMTFTQYLTKLRMDHARQLLRTSHLPLKAVCESVGYNDYFYFDKVFKKNTGLTPTEYRKNNEQA